MRVPFASESLPPWSSVSPFRIRSRVVLPAPFGPESETRSAAPDLERDPVEQRVAGQLLAEVGCGDDGHALSVEAARIHKVGAPAAQTRLISRGTLAAGGGWSSPHPGGDERLPARESDYVKLRQA